MNNKQILKRLADIEGIGFCAKYVKGIGSYGGRDIVYMCKRCHFQGKHPIAYTTKGREVWNPLTNPADAFALVEKHDVWIESDGDGWHAFVDGVVAVDPDLKRAICLAVIEARPEAHDG